MPSLYASTRWLLEYKTSRGAWRIEDMGQSLFDVKEKAEKIYWLAQLGMLDGKKPFQEIGE